jgi:hypothetical protein
MADPNIKEKLIQKINATTDTSILYEVYDIFEFREQEGIYEMNAEQRKAIEEARAQIENHQVLSNDEANNTTDEWLSK